MTVNACSAPSSTPSAIPAASSACPNRRPPPARSAGHRDTPLWLAPAFDTPQVRDFVRFHTGAPIVAQPVDALFAVLTPDQMPPLDGFAVGTDPYPDRSATLVIELPSLVGGPQRWWRGPGIETHQTVALADLPESFWNGWAANRVLFPCGVDLVFAADADLIALPRSIAVET